MKQNFIRLRSLLYVPASREHFVKKAHLRNADAIILDLEDSVLVEDKGSARDNLPRTIAQVGAAGALVFVRINSECELQKLDVEAACIGGADGIYVPKASVSVLRQVDQLLNKFEQGSSSRKKVDLVALIEDVAGMLEAREIAKCPRVMALSLGGEDFANSLGAEPNADVLKMPKLMVHYAAKAEGLLSLGLMVGVADYADLKAMKLAAQQAKLHGFDGATCVHPDVVAVLNDVFTASMAQIDWARRVVDAAAGSSVGAFEMDGKMIDAPIVARAQRILDRFTT